MTLKLLGENMEEDKSWKDYVFEVPIDAKRTYRYEKDHSHDMSYENERKHDNVHSPSHYKHGKKETIDVIRDCMRMMNIMGT